jgi:predicted dehydrogenase
MINIAMLSCAHIHTRGYASDIAKRENCGLAAIWDDVPDRGRRYAGEFKSEFLPDLEAVLARQDIDGFVICAENTRHLPLLKAAIPVRKPIFCEKPFTTASADAAEAMRLIRKHGTVVHMGYGMPFGTKMQGLKRLLVEGALGTLTHARVRSAHNAAYGRWFDSPDLAWFTDPALSGGGAFMDLGTHAVHAVRSLLGPVVKVFATIANKSGAYPNVDDYGLAVLQFLTGVTCTVEASWVQNGGIGGMEICGGKGSAYNDPKLGLIYSVPNQDPQPVPDAPARPTGVARLVAAIEGQLTRDEVDADLICSADAVAIMEACYESSRTGQWAGVPRI